ncbi:unnamed protein product [Calicophoron daubneyi]|uniref:Protein Wnt n=1 Tax=Calicophoron daubneyi TaxID=300641 RepID=A0AAV2TVN1_CALDB
MLTSSAQLRNIIAANQPMSPQESNMDDLLISDRSRERSEGNGPITPLGYVANRSQPYWRMGLAHPNQGSPTASMQRRLPIMSSPYSIRGRENSSYSGNAVLWNNRTLHDPNLYQYPKQSSNTRSLVTRPSSTAASENFVGPDGKLQMSICEHPNGFLRRQKKLCRRYLHLMESVVRGYFMGLRECEHQFAAHRWNCQGHNITLKVMPKNKRRLRHRQSRLSNDPEEGQPKPVRIKTYLDKLLSRGTRESAYVLAVTAAGVSHAVTKACSSGMHDNCGCDRTIYDHPREPNFEWSGCSDNIHFGAAFSRQFLDVRERSRLKRNPKLGLTNLHNNHVGRQAVINKMEVQCKCHGVSGSCEMRTCWRSLPKFRDLGNHLQERYHKALMVDYVDRRLMPIENVELGPAQPEENTLSPRRLSYTSGTTKHPDKTVTITENDLLYTSHSPTFCHHDPQFGSIGTYGRRCVEGAKGLNSCDYLCCDRGFKRETFVQEERCNCKFQWCCKVLCQTCTKTVVISTCN